MSHMSLSEIPVEAFSMAQINTQYLDALDDAEMNWHYDMPKLYEITEGRHLIEYGFHIFKRFKYKLSFNKGKFELQT